MVLLAWFRACSFDRRRELHGSCGVVFQACSMVIIKCLDVYGRPSLRVILLIDFDEFFEHRIGVALLLSFGNTSQRTRHSSRRRAHIIMTALLTRIPIPPKFNSYLLLRLPRRRHRPSSTSITKHIKPEVRTPGSMAPNEILFILPPWPNLLLQVFKLFLSKDLFNFLLLCINGYLLDLGLKMIFLFFHLIFDFFQILLERVLKAINRWIHIMISLDHII